MMKLLLSLVLCYIGFCLLIYLYQKNLLFFPDKTSLAHCPSLNAVGGFHYESPDKRTRLYHIPTNHPEPKGWILHFHGNAGRACDRLETSKEFLSMGYHLVLSEYPGYAQDASLPSTADILETAEKSYEYIASRNESQLPIILFGESIGTGPATFLASKNLKYVSALILQTPFPSLSDIGQAHYFYLPVKLLLKHDLATAKWAKDISIPVFAFHGDLDEVIPFRLGKQQVQNFSTALVTFWVVKGAHHNDLLFVAADELWVRISNFLNDRLSER